LMLVMMAALQRVTAKQYSLLCVVSGWIETIKIA
jgi:hypothetical protein